MPIYFCPTFATPCSPAPRNDRDSPRPAYWSPASARRLGFILALLLFAILAYRPAAAGTFAKSYGTPGGSTIIAATAVDTAKQTYVGGSFNSATITLGGVTLTRIGLKDMFVAKLDSSGNVIWARNFGGGGASTEPGDIAVDSAGNVYVNGEFNSASLTTPALTKIGSQDVFAIKLDSNGGTTWARNFGGSGASLFSFGIAVDGVFNVYVGGDFTSANLTTPALTKIGNTDVFAIKLDSNGVTTWARNFGGSGAVAYQTRIAVDGLLNVYLSGLLGFSNLTTPALTRIGSSDALVIKLNSSGGTTWARNFGGANADVNGTIAVDSAGNVYLGGYFQTANLTTPALTRIGNTDIFAAKLDTNGTTTWAKNFGGSAASALLYQIAVDGAGNVYLSGTFNNANLTTPALTKIGVNDAYAIKLTATGNTAWARNFGGSGASALASSIAVAGDGNVYLGGQFSGASLTRPALSKIGTVDAFIFNIPGVQAPGPAILNLLLN